MAKRIHNNKGRIEGPFTPLLISTMDARAWRQLSHGAVRLYISLKRRVPNQRNIAWLSIRNASLEVRASPRKIQEFFAELQHYGFIVLHTHGCLGTDGKGKAPHYRLTELGQTKAASAGGELRAADARFPPLGWHHLRAKEAADQYVAQRLE